MSTAYPWRRTIIALLAITVAVIFALTPPPSQLIDEVTDVLASTSRNITREEAYNRALSLSPKIMAMIGIAIMALILWSTEAIPIPLTGVLIILFIALFNIMPLSTAVSYIAADVNILILAGLVISVALSRHSVDKYLSLKVLSVMGNRADMIVLGMILSTALLSMWIPNTAAAAIMIPVAVGILELLGAKKGDSKLGKAMMIGVAYGASIGGIGTPVGTPPVPITIRNVKEATNVDISFATWMMWGVPLSLLLVVLAWILLMLFYKPEVSKISESYRIVTEELRKLGGLVGSRRKTLFLFLVAVVLWLLDPIMSNYVANWTYVVSLIIITIFIAPGLGVLDWDYAAREIDWGTLFLVAGGLALGGGLRATRITDLLSRLISTYLRGLSPVTMLFIVGLISGLAITIFCSITATSSAMVPIAIAIAKALNLNPLIAAVTAGIASCFAFLLPANTPPNAIAYSHGYFKSSEMARVGIVLIIASVLVTLPFAVFIVPYIMRAPLVTE